MNVTRIEVNTCCRLSELGRASLNYKQLDIAATPNITHLTPLESTYQYREYDAKVLKNLLANPATILFSFNAVAFIP
jgi:hypothetical protein